jgi:hypothetical protein
MKITKSQLKQIIKEELESVLRESDGLCPTKITREERQKRERKLIRALMDMGPPIRPGERSKRRDEEETQQIAYLLQSVDGWGDPGKFYDEYIQTAKKMMLGHPSGTKYRHPTIRAKLLRCVVGEEF